MNLLVADTHAIVWYLEKNPQLSATAEGAMQKAGPGGGILVASITLVEIAYLIEKGRLPQITFDRLGEVLADPAGEMNLVDLDVEVARAIRLIPRTDVPDMPDRIIAATALHLNLPLISRGRKIQASAIRTIW